MTMTLDQLIAARLRQAFRWGVHDCCLWAADVVLATTGRDLAAGLRGTYGDEAEARVVLERLGGLAAIGALAGPEIAPLAAARGDVGLVDFGGVQSLAACDGPHWLAAGRRGLAVLPFEAGLRAWRVAHA